MLRGRYNGSDGVSVTFKVAPSERCDSRGLDSSGSKGDYAFARASSASPKLRGRKAELSPRTSPTTTSSPPSSFASSFSVYLGFYWWILVITAGLGPTLWSSMWLCWTLGKSVRGWLCLAASAVYWLTLTKLVPCDPESPPEWAKRIATFVLDRTVAFFAGGVDVVLDDASSFEEEEEDGREEETGKNNSTPCVVGFEPHSTLPMAAVLAFARYSPLSPSLPRRLRGARLLASSACFSAPVVRHAWSWLGFAPASRATMYRLLTTGKVTRESKNSDDDDDENSESKNGSEGSTCGVSVVLCPGGIREVLHLRRDSETVYLRRRRGFVRQALAAGAPLVPAFAFGQTRAFEWFPLLPSPFPFSEALVARLCRAVGFAPLWIHNGWLVPFPKRSTRMTLVIGKPIEFVPRRKKSESPCPSPAAPSPSPPSSAASPAASPALSSSSSSSSSPSSSSSSSSSSSLSSSDSDGDLKRTISSSQTSPSSSSFPPAFDEEDVERYLAEFVGEMQSLYERHAPALGCGDVPLTIL